MQTKETYTYLLYSRGLMPNDLTLGSLHLDPANPIDSERKVFLYTSPVDVRRLRPVQIDERCSLHTQASTEWLVGAGVLGLLKGDLGPTKSVEVTVSGKSGRRLQLADPEAFLNEVILKSEAARSWLSAKLSVLHRMPLVAKVQKAVSKPPKIWMVTGVQYVQKGAVTSVSNTAWSGGLHATIPTPDPTLVAAIAAIPSVEATASATIKGGTTSTYGHAEERVWAAQFRALKVEYRRPSEKEDGESWIELHDAKNLGRHGVRAAGAGGGNGGEEDHASVAQVAGVSDDHVLGSEASAESILDAMLVVDWTLLDELLDLQEEEAAGRGDGEEGAEAQDS